MSNSRKTSTESMHYLRELILITPANFKFSTLFIITCILFSYLSNLLTDYNYVNIVEILSFIYLPVALSFSTFIGLKQYLNRMKKMNKSIFIIKLFTPFVIDSIIFLSLFSLIKAILPQSLLNHTISRPANITVFGMTFRNTGVFIVRPQENYISATHLLYPLSFFLLVFVQTIRELNRLKNNYKLVSKSNKEIMYAFKGLASMLLVIPTIISLLFIIFIPQSYLNIAHFLLMSSEHTAFIAINTFFPFSVIFQTNEL